MEIKGVVFDMDGVILDTEKLYVHFWCQAANLCGYPMEKSHALSIRSLARPFAIQRLKGCFGEDFDYHKVHRKRIELMDKYIEENGIEPKPCADYLLSRLKEKGFKTAVATATGIERTEKYLRQTGLYGYFDEIISAAMVANGKPEPDIYLKACESLGLLPENCMALEDSPNGILAASRAGCVTVMVPDLDEPDDKVRELVYSVARNLKEVEDFIDEINLKK